MVFRFARIVLTEHWKTPFPAKVNSKKVEGNAKKLGKVRADFGDFNEDIGKARYQTDERFPL